MKEDSCGTIGPIAGLTMAYPTYYWILYCKIKLLTSYTFSNIEHWNNRNRNWLIVQCHLCKLKTYKTIYYEVSYIFNKSSPWGREESDTTERLPFHFSFSCIGEGNGSPLHCSCLESPRDGGAWWAAVYGVTQSRTRLKWLGSSSSSIQKTCRGRGHWEGRKGKTLNEIKWEGEIPWWSSG